MKEMMALSGESRAILACLINGLKKPGDSKRVDNSPGCFMAVSVEHIGLTNMGPVFSVTHYYQQNGDLMCDPDMTFLQGEKGQFWPLSFQNDGVAVYEESVEFGDDGNPVRFNAGLQRKHAEFADQWMKNIKEQQGLVI